MLKIWGRTNSVNVKKVLWAADELGLKYERVDAGLHFGIVDTPEYKKLNPNSLVPTIDDDGLVLWESHSIVRYLAAKYGEGKLWPANPRARADVDRWMDWTFTLQTGLGPVFRGLVRTPPEKRDPKAIEEGRKKAAELLSIPNAMLAGRQYLGGSELSMGDIPLGCHVQLWMRLPIERPTYPNLDAWFERLCARPAYKKNVDIPLS